MKIKKLKEFVGSMPEELPVCVVDCRSGILDKAQSVVLRRFDDYEHFDGGDALDELNVGDWYLEISIG